jgi:hypothetical protein
MEGAKKIWTFCSMDAVDASQAALLAQLSRRFGE